MTDELVKRHVEQLRMTGGDLADLCRPLADAIDALIAERDRLAGINVKLCENFNTLLIDGARLEDRAKAAEEKCDQLREALTDALGAWDTHNKHGDPIQRRSHGEKISQLVAKCLSVCVSKCWRC